MGRIRLLVALLLLCAVPLLAQRTRVSPGWNLFSPQQDVEIGREVSREAERELRLITDATIQNYLRKIGQQLVAHAPGEKYPYEFKVVNDRELNAFALPGGFLYVNRGIFENADNEAQLAGVVAHEIAHIALRHGTNQMTKAYAAQAPLALLGSLIGSDSIGGMITQLGASFAANSILLKFSRDAESQADILGTQMLHDANLDPVGMAQFFQKLEAKGSGGAEFFSSHPNPGNRAASVNEEIRKLGGQRNYRKNSAEFQQIQRRIRSLR